MKTRTIYWLIATLFAILIAVNTWEYSPSDDIGFLKAHLAGRWYGFELIYGARFFPLHGAELHLFKDMFDNDTLFLMVSYMFSAVTFLASARLLWIFLKDKKISSFFYLSLLLLIFSPGAVAPFFRLLYSERYVLFLFFSLSYLIIYKERNFKWLFLMILCSISSFLLKEIAIATVFTIGVCFLIRSFKNKNTFEKAYGITIVTISIIYLILYYNFIYKLSNDVYGTEDTFIPKTIFTIKAVIEWCIADPLIILGFIPLAGIFLIRKALRIKEFFLFSNQEILVVAAFAYITALLLIGIGYAEHYMTPVYGFVLPIILIFYTSDFLRNNIFRYVATGIIVLQIGVMFPGINAILFEHYNNKNLKRSIIEMKENKEIWNKDLFVICGTDWGGQFVYYYPTLLSCSNVQINENFSLKSYEKKSVKVDMVFNGNYKSFLIGNQQPKKGDLILVTPYCESNYLKPFKNTEIVEKWNAPCILKLWNTKDFCRFIFNKITPDNKYVRNKKTGVKVGEYSLYRYDDRKTLMTHNSQ